MAPDRLSALPSVDRLLNTPIGNRLIALFGRPQVTAQVRAALSQAREQHRLQGNIPPLSSILNTVSDALALAERPRPQSVLNLTGTVLHTNLGRAQLPNEAIERIAAVASEPSNLEYDLDHGERGERDRHLESILCELTGAEAATVVNNNAAALLLLLNTLAQGREVPVSRGELIEIGGSFRIPDIMSRSGCRLIEVGTTNRTHLRDYSGAINPATALLMKVHTSNYHIDGFTAAVGVRELKSLAHEHLPLVVDLGSGTLVDLARYGLPAEPTVQESLQAGADLVTFSGDKLLGGPQAGIIVGRTALIDQLRRNPLRRALRVDKMTIAALFEVLKLYRVPDALPARLPTYRFVTRTQEEIRQVADSVLASCREHLKHIAHVEVVSCTSQIGSGALPTGILPSWAIELVPLDGGDEALQDLARAFRSLPLPVVGRIHNGRLLFDLRTLDRAETFQSQLSHLAGP